MERHRYVTEEGELVMRSHVLLTAAALLATGIFAPALGSAQSVPSADQIINSLTPIGAPAPMSRGIRVVPTGVTQGSVPTLAHHAPTPTHGPVSAISLTVQFANGSAGLTPQAVQVLDNLGRALSNPALIGYMFRIEGHTDTVGTAQYNEELSDRRANAVADYVANNFHVDRSHLEAVGMGKDGLLVPTPDQTPEPRNRRVQVVNVGVQE
jgi:outer membrane protein OmpA-like peptidoglycan-associated protein